ncbi:hypothetical protein QVG61_12290 [Thiohalobacter sp. IOR34]|uniref:hypothetical protein n=1 Tax=Thiohalobacter sp. IOR34 TaxID=3057176 RepID=UPI0025B0953E|nr:hypothetical protein [Thiohalobacter sp. IOR34]WJW75252.1 hypothetical protein QVG61_12290 [Thiohalobacter sp. IOR34]
MSGINLRPDDLGLQSLKDQNQAPNKARAVSPAAPYPRVQPGGERPAAERSAASERPRVERRKGGDRRKRNLPVILDTRTQRERRREPNDEQSTPVRGVDTFI